MFSLIHLYSLPIMSSASSDANMEKPNNQHVDLSSQMTLSQSPDQYERLFFQPTAAKGDLAKRLGMSLSSIRQRMLIRARKSDAPRSLRLLDTLLKHCLLSPPIPRLLSNLTHSHLRIILLPGRNCYEHSWNRRIHPREHFSVLRVHHLWLPLGQCRLHGGRCPSDCCELRFSTRLTRSLEPRIQCGTRELQCGYGPDLVYLFVRIPAHQRAIRYYILLPSFCH
jgi:hypothetical protein